jgi:hypothetical protein
MPHSGTTSIRTRLNTYTAYGVGCAAAWAVILIVTQRRTSSQTRNTIRLTCAGWWLGWMSATIARVVYPPPKKLKPEAYNRVVVGSIVLLAVGILRLIRLLMAEEERAGADADASAPLGRRPLTHLRVRSRSRMPTRMRRLTLKVGSGPTSDVASRWAFSNQIAHGDALGGDAVVGRRAASPRRSSPSRRLPRVRRRRPVCLSAQGSANAPCPA